MGKAGQGTGGKLGGGVLSDWGAEGSVKMRGLDLQIKESVIVRS